MTNPLALALSASGLTLLAAPAALPTQDAAASTAHPAQEAAARSAQDDVESALRARLERSSAERDLAGYTAIVALAGDALVAQASGEQVDGGQLALETRFRVPALLRSLTSIAVLRLVQQEKVALDGPIGDYLTFPLEAQPGWAKSGGEHDVVTVEQLLAGTSGLIGWDGVLTRDQRASATRDELLHVVALQGLAADPGHCFEPNESELLVLGALVEAVTEAPLSKAIGTLLADAGVGGGFVSEDDAPAAIDAAASFELDGDPVDAPAELFPFGEDRLAFSAPELAMLVRAMADRKVLDEGMLDDLLRGQKTHRGQDTGFGLGVDLVRLDEFTGVVVGGRALGQAVHVARYPDADLTIVLLAAAPRGLEDPRLGTLERDLARTALGLRPPGVQDLELPGERAAMFTGAYMLGCDRLEVRRSDDGHLVLDRIDRRTTTLLYQGDRRFVAQHDAETSFEFVMDRDEPVARVIVLFEHGLRSEAVRIE